MIVIFVTCVADFIVARLIAENSVKGRQRVPDGVKGANGALEGIKGKGH
ncbi:MAG: hypothetical protein WCS67_02650 [Bacteroidales bacterium]